MAIENNYLRAGGGPPLLLMTMGQRLIVDRCLIEETVAAFFRVLGNAIAIYFAVVVKEVLGSVVWREEVLRREVGKRRSKCGWSVNA